MKTAEEDQQNEDDNIIRVDIPGITTDESASTANFAQPSTKKKGTVTKTYGGKSNARNIKHTSDQKDKVSKEITTGGEGVDVERHQEGNPAQKGKGKTTSVVVVVGNDKDNAAEGGSQCTRAPHPTATAGTNGSAHTAMVTSPQEPEADVQTSQTNGPEKEPCPATSHDSAKPKDNREEASPSTTTTTTTTTPTDGSPSQPASTVVASSALLHPSTSAAPLKRVHDETSLPSAGTFRILHIHCACLLKMLFQRPRMSNHQTNTLTLTGIRPRAAILSPKRATTSRISLQCPRIIGTVGLMTCSTSTLINGVDVVILGRLTCHPPATALRHER